MDKCKGCNRQFGYWELWKAYWRNTVRIRWSSRHITCPSCKQKHAPTYLSDALVILEMLGFVFLIYISMMMSSESQFALAEGLSNIWMAAPAITIGVAFLFPLFVRYRKTS